MMSHLFWFAGSLTGKQKFCLTRASSFYVLTFGDTWTARGCKERRKQEGIGTCLPNIGSSCLKDFSFKLSLIIVPSPDFKTLQRPWLLTSCKESCSWFIWFDFVQAGLVMSEMQNVDKITKRISYINHLHFFFFWDQLLLFTSSWILMKKNLLQNWDGIICENKRD